MEKISTPPPQGGPDLIGALGLSDTVDLSHPVSRRMGRWPGDPPTEFEPWSDIAGTGYFLRRFSMSEHGGTHLTAPASYYANGRSVDQYSPADLVRPAVVIDVRDQCSANSDYALNPNALAAWESRHGMVPTGSLVLLLTGWSGYWSDPSIYLGNESDGELHFPGFGPEAADMLVYGRDVAGLGTDSAGLEPGSDTGLSVSRLVLAQPRIALENLTNLDRLPPTGAVLVIGILKLEGGSGSPAAVTAFLPNAG